MRYRIEKDNIGEKQVPAEAYYGIGALRSKEAFAITKHGITRQMIKGLATIKKSAAKANCDIGLLSKEVANAISLSCDEVFNGRLHGQFITDVVQGGSGSGMNMNANEVIANRANEIMGGEKGKYNFVHPLDHVNLNQTNNDVVLIAGKYSVIRLTKKLLTEVKKLYNAYHDKLNMYELSKHEPNSIGQEFSSFADVLERDMKRVHNTMSGLLEVHVGSDLMPLEKEEMFVKKFIKYLAQYTGESMYQTKNVFDNSRNLDSLTSISSALKLLSSNLSKVANDLGLMANQNKVILPKVYTTDTPVVIELVKQVSVYIMGNDLTISRAVESGELESNIYQPIIYACLFEIINMIRRTIRTFREKVIEDLQIVVNNKNPILSE